MIGTDSESFFTHGTLVPLKILTHFSTLVKRKQKKVFQNFHTDAAQTLPENLCPDRVTKFPKYAASFKVCHTQQARYRDAHPGGAHTTLLAEGALPLEPRRRTEAQQAGSQGRSPFRPSGRAEMMARQYVRMYAAAIHFLCSLHSGTVLSGVP